MVPSRYILRSLAARKIRTLLTILGVALVVGIYSIMSSVAETMVRSFRTTGLPDEVVVIQGGALSVDFSNIERNSLPFVQTLDGVALAEEHPLVSSELCLGSIVQVRGLKFDATVRGVTGIAPAVYRQAGLLSGDWPQSGRRTTLGRAIASKLGLNIGDDFELENERWTVAGIIDGGGCVYDQEIWVDLDDLAAAANRTTYSSYTLRAVDAHAASALVEAVNNGRLFPLMARSASDFYAATGAMSIFMAYIGTFISIIIAIGAVFGGMNTMYSAVAGRRREIGILRSLGFGRGAVLLSFLCESCAISLAGGFLGLVFGIGLSMIPVDLPYLSASRVVIGMPQVISSLMLALCVGIIGGGLPSLQAARMQVVDALR